MIDFTPATERLTRLVTAVADDRLDVPTPCPDARLGDLLDHIGALAVAFTGAARKDRTHSDPPPPPSAAHLEPGWRERIGRDLADLAKAWAEPSAWDGDSRVGGVDMPAQVTGLIALDELVVHGWDIAVATGQPYQPTDPEVEAAISIVSTFDAPRDGNLFGPVVPVADTAPALDRLLGLTGRDPEWQPPAQ